MEPEPNRIVPRPFPLDPSEALERSLSLDVTPERAPPKRKRPPRRKNQQENEERGAALPAHLSEPSHHPAQLSTPELNSTAHLLDRMRLLKQAQHQQQSAPSLHAHLQSDPCAARLYVDGLEDMMQRPLKEVNVPRDSTRYKNLVSVELSDESFQKLTFKPRTRVRTRHAKSGQDLEEPRLLDFMLPGLQHESAEWSSPAPPAPPPSHHMQMDADDVFAYDEFIRNISK